MAFPSSMNFAWNNQTKSEHQSFKNDFVILENFFVFTRSFHFKVFFLTCSIFTQMLAMLIIGCYFDRPHKLLDFLATCHGWATWNWEPLLQQLLLKRYVGCLFLSAFLLQHLLHSKLLLCNLVLCCDTVSKQRCDDFLVRKTRSISFSQSFGSSEK